MLRKCLKIKTILDEVKYKTVCEYVINECFVSQNVN